MMLLNMFITGYGDIIAEITESGVGEVMAQSFLLL